MNLILLLTLVAIVAIVAQPMRMAALAANVQRNQFPNQSIRGFRVAATTHIYKGGAVGLNSTGYLVPFTTATLFVGMAYEEIDNSAGLDGAKFCRVEIGDFVLPIAAFAQGDIGKPVYASTDNDFTLSPSAAGQIGNAVGFEAAGFAIVRVEPQFNQVGNLVSSVREVQCAAGALVPSADLMPPIVNKGGAVIVGAFAIVTEVFGGAAQDQGIVALQDSDGTALNLTFTAADAAADAAGDFIQEGGTNDTLIGAASGDAGALVAAGKGVRAVVTQPTSGAGAAGKMKVAAIIMLM